MAIIEDDKILIEQGAGRYYQATLAPGCAGVLDAMANVQLQEPTSGIRRGTVFVVDGRTCPVMSLDGLSVRRGAAQSPATTGGSGRLTEWGRIPYFPRLIRGRLAELWRNLAAD
ncbi:MAG: hypothetical protein WDM79_15650 [Terricaulis sp.]